MSQNPKVPASGPDVYCPTPGDKRPMFPVAVGGHVLACRLAGPTSKQEPAPIVREIIRMEDKPFSKKEYPDPYHLDGV